MDRTFVKEMLGSMTRFEMLTPELLSEAASEGLTYKELESSMSQLGLDIRKILIDPNKKYRQAYYADFEKGFSAMNSGKSGKVILDWTSLH